MEMPVSLDGEFWGVTAYFNPAGYCNKRDHLRLFSTRIRQQGLKLLVVELAFGDAPFDLEMNLADRIVRLRSNTVLWQKERLLNVGFENLPDDCDKVAWLDGDIVFENDAWVAKASELLRENVVVQPFNVAWWLPPNYESRLPNLANPEFRARSQHMPGAAYAHICSPGQHMIAGHPGFAWCARRSLLKDHGLYDRCILGGADHLVGAAMYSHCQVDSTQAWLREFCTEAQIADLLHWSKGFYAAVQRNVAYVEGVVLHLWHGSLKNRQYEERHKILSEMEFDPRKDIVLDGNGCWQWASEKPDLHRKVVNYFLNRRETEELDA